MIYILLIWFLPEYPSKGLMRLYIFISLYINVFFGQRVGYVLNGILPKFWQNSKCQNIFLGLGYMIGWVDYCFLNGLEYQMPCGPLNEFLKTGIHLKVRGDYHVQTFPGRGVTLTISFRNLWYATRSVHFLWTDRAYWKELFNVK